MDYEEIVSTFSCLVLTVSASPTLRRLHSTLEVLIKEKDALQTRLSEELGEPLLFIANDRRQVLDAEMDSWSQSYRACQFERF